MCFTYAKLRTSVLAQRCWSTITQNACSGISQSVEQIKQRHQSGSYGKHVVVVRSTTWCTYRDNCAFASKKGIINATPLPPRAFNHVDCFSISTGHVLFDKNGEENREKKKHKHTQTHTLTHKDTPAWMRTHRFRLAHARTHARTRTRRYTGPTIPTHTPTDAPYYSTSVP